MFYLGNHEYYRHHELESDERNLDSGVGGWRLRVPERLYYQRLTEARTRIQMKSRMMLRMSMPIMNFI